MKVAMFPLNGPSAGSMVPPEFLDLAEKAFGADISNVNIGDEPKMEKEKGGYFWYSNNM